MPGAEAAGEVVESSSLPAGTPVWCLPMTGGLAELVSVPDAAVVPVPDGVGLPLAAALGIAGLAGWIPVRDRGGLAPGETVVVLGAGGAVGQTAIRAARDGGAGRIVAAARSAAGRERATAAGADVAVPIDDGLGEALRAACGEGADLVIDPLWGAPGTAAMGRCAGEAASSRWGAPPGPRARSPAGALRGGRLDIRGFSVFSEEPADVARAYADLAAAAARGAVTMNVGRGAVRRGAGGVGPGVGRRGRQAGRHPVSEGFAQEMAAGYGFEGPRIHVGRPMAAPGGEPPDTSVDVALPLGMLNRHGLIAGATGTGKTQDPAADRRAALGGRRAGVPGRHQGRPVRAGARRARRATASPQRAREHRLRLDSRRRSRWSS